MAAEKQKTNNTVTDEMIYLQFAGREVSVSDIRRSIWTDYEEAKGGEDKSGKIRIYLKPEDQKAYYVINDDYAGETAF